MTLMQMEPSKDTEVVVQRHHYTIPHLIEIGCKTNTSVGISRFSAEALQGQSHYPT
jgi:hypothetical protein